MVLFVLKPTTGQGRVLAMAVCLDRAPIENSHCEQKGSFKPGELLLQYKQCAYKHIS